MLQLSDFKQKVTTEIYRATGSGSGLTLTLRRILAEVESVLARHEEVDFSHIDCHAGCRSCCVVNVSVLFPEALAIADEVRSWPDSEQQKLTERLDELWRAVRGLTDDERISLSRPCAFLDDAGCCRIYPVRPILCRSVTSTSAEACRAALVEPLFEEKPQVQMNLAQKELFEAVYLGVGDGLERAGIDGRGAKLTGFVRYLLREPVAAHRLLRGEKIDWHEFA